MPRYSCLIEYDGRPYKGFQAQENLPTVQGVIEDAIFKFSGERLRLTAAGRTDTGVHATGQVVTFDLQKTYRGEVVANALNAHLMGEPVSVLEAAQVPDDFSARFSATGRMYLYRILNRRAPPALDLGRVWHVKKPLDAQAMHAAAKALIGLHDFTTFRHVECQAKSPIKTLDIARVARVGDEVHLVFASRSFLHRQVRSMVGTLAEVGIGRWDIDDVKAALEAKDRTACGQVAPPEGLFLTHVTYEAEPDFESRCSI
ncbi:tRNA pseudouridine(38-40) synthase TruA [Asticcacaulis endophyticus]|uniref:tRNA pseudouridine synthase A n=1 Tax=Asticcacaulis endophyticus TaxID=1395890 RepID=A0A918PRT5_9CAUL|nr:tRNA pseudouridine(38-40) synthase TruA [Asticcacaulis endophyticus]GGZ19788.1 tRNA pseudouridine synthase A [Asticcacaulis endophyticus]